MKKCLACGVTFPSLDSCCPACNWGPGMHNGFPAYAPDMAQEGGGFKITSFAELARIEEGNFWFRARNRLIIWALGKYYPEFKSFLEIGCGTGYVISGLTGAFPGVQFHGSEIFTAGLAFAVARQPNIDFVQMDARHIPFVDEFDAIGAFDVLEHIKEDEQVLLQIHEALKPNGVMLITVPQHGWLWSPIDEYSCHERRYSAKELHTKAESAGFKILRSTSFVSTLLPVMCASRFKQKHTKNDFDSTSEAKISHRLNRIFESFLNFEVAMIRNGLNFPLGGSRLIVAKKL
jgi:SAM-dependent methyltransferase